MIHDVEPMELRSRCAPDLHHKIKAAAEESVRSMSAEIAYRLQKSFQIEAAAPATSTT
jgi:Arc-like DNA binding dprotein